MIDLVDAVDTRLARAAREVCADRVTLSGVYALQVAREAFAVRALLARSVERSLDVQYYIWRGDTTGCLLLEELWNAADRGVRVRLLLDDNGIAGLDRVIAALNTHRNIQVRLFNPFPNRRFKLLGYLTNFRRLNRRMHNKSFTADAGVTIVGGRNVGDEYFGADQALEFADLDVLAVGPIAGKVTAAFDRYWNDDSAVPADAVVGAARVEDVSNLQAQFAGVRASTVAATYLETLQESRLVDALIAHELPFEWTQVSLLCDPPSKVKDQASEAELVFTNLGTALGSPTRSIDIISPYFVPGRKGTAALAGYARRGIALRVLTNSLAATDVSVVHAGYARRRRPLLRSGATLYELKPGRATPRPQRGPGLRGRGGSSATSLHAKTFSVDGARVFVGSLNFDPRSIRLNTEMGLVVESARLAELVANEIEQAGRSAAYEVVLAGHGRRLQWVERIGRGELRHRAEPQTSFLKRLLVVALEWLPIEGLL